MRHNKSFGWQAFLDVVEQVQKVSPWLSRQIAKRASEWPFWYSGLNIKEWRENQVRVNLPQTFRNSVDGEICQGHLLLGAELALRLVLLRYRQEFPFRYRLMGSRVDLLRAVDQSVDYRFEIPKPEFERLRLELARETRAIAEYAVNCFLEDGRSVGTFTFQAAFELEKFLPA